MIENRAVPPVNFTNVQLGLPNWAIVEKCCFSQVVKKSLFMINAFSCFPPPTIVTARQVPKGMELEAERKMLESHFELSVLLHSGKCDWFWRNCCFFIENTIVSVVVGCHKILKGYNKVFFLCLLAESKLVFFRGLELFVKSDTSKSAAALIKSCNLWKAQYTSLSSCFMLPAIVLGVQPKEAPVLT